MLLHHLKFRKKATKNESPEAAKMNKEGILSLNCAICDRKKIKIDLKTRIKYIYDP